MTQLIQRLRRISSHVARRPQRVRGRTSFRTEPLEQRTLLTAIIQGQIWDDVNSNAIQNSHEPGRNGILVGLKDLEGTLLQSVTTSDADLNNDGSIDPIHESGIYQFEVQTGGQFFVEILSLGYFGVSNPYPRRTVAAAIEEPVAVSSASHTTGRIYASTSAGRIFEYHVESNAVIRSLEIGGAVSHLAVSPDGQSLAAASWDEDSGLLTVHSIDLNSAQTRSWQHAPNVSGGTGRNFKISGIEWAGDEKLFLIVGSYNGSASAGRQLLAFDLASQQFEINRSFPFGASMTGTESGQTVVIQETTLKARKLFVYDARTQQWTEIADDVDRPVQFHIRAANSDGSRFLIYDPTKSEFSVVDDRFHRLFTVPEHQNAFHFRTNENTLIGYKYSGGPGVRLDADSGESLPVDFNAQADGLTHLINVNGQEYLVGTDRTTFQREDFAPVPRQRHSQYVEVNDGDVAELASIGAARPSLISWSLGDGYHNLRNLNEGGVAESVEFVLNQKPTSGVTVTISVDDLTEVRTDKTELVFTPNDWMMPQTVKVWGLEDDLVDRDESSKIRLQIDNAVSAPEFADAKDVELITVTLNRDIAIQGRVSTYVAPPQNFPSTDPVEYLDGVTIDLFNELGQLVDSSVTSSTDRNGDNVVDSEYESGWYAFDLLQPGYYTVQQRGIGPVGQPSPSVNSIQFRWLRDTYDRIGVLDPNRPYAYATRTDGIVVRQDTRSSGEPLALKIGESARGVAMSADGDFLFVGEGLQQDGRFTVYRLDLNTLEHTSHPVVMPEGQYSIQDVKSSPAGNLYVTVYRPLVGMAVYNVDLSSADPSAMLIYESDRSLSIIGFDGSGDRMLIHNGGSSGTAVLFDPIAKQVIKTSADGITPVAINAAGDMILGQRPFSNHVLLNGDLEVIQELGQFPGGGVFHPDGVSLYLGNGRDQVLQRINLNSMEVISSQSLQLPSSGLPTSFELSSSGDDLLVNDRSVYLYRIDPAGSDAAVRTVNVNWGNVLKEENFTQTAPQIAVSVPTGLLTLKEESVSSREVEFRLSEAPSSDVVVTVNAADSTEVNLVEQTFVFTPDNWNTDRVIMIRPADDNEPDGHQTTQISFEVNDAASDPLFHGVLNTIDVTTLDDETELSGRIWKDTNSDGIVNRNELGINGRSVQLLGSDLTVLQTVITEDRDLNEDGVIDPITETGWYTFLNAPTGNVFVRHLDVNESGQTFPTFRGVHRVELSDIRQHAYSSQTDIVYAASAGEGVIERFHVSLQQQLAPLPVGGTPVSVQVSADGRSLWIGFKTPQGTDIQIQKLNLASGEISSYSFEGTPFEFGVEEFVLTADNRIMFVTAAPYLRSRLLELLPETGEVRELRTFNQDEAFVALSGDRRTASFTNRRTPRTVTRFDSLTGEFESVGDLPENRAGNAEALSGNGRWFAVAELNGTVKIFGRDLELTRELDYQTSSVAFAPVGSILYILQPGQQQVLAVDVVTGQETGLYTLEKAVVDPSRSTMKVSDDGEYLFLHSSEDLQIVRIGGRRSAIPPALSVDVHRGDRLTGFDLGVRPPQFVFDANQEIPRVREGRTSTLGGIRLSEKPTSAVKVGLTHDNPTELTITQSVFTFTPENWSEYQSVFVSGATDNVTDGDQVETLRFTVIADQSAPEFSEPGVQTVSVTVKDADLPGIKTNSNLVTLEEGKSSEQIVIALNYQPTADVRLNLDIGSANSLRLESRELLFTPSNWNIGQIVPVTAIQNGVIRNEPSVELRVSVDQQSSADEYHSVNDVSITINIDNSNVINVDNWSVQTDGNLLVRWSVDTSHLSNGPFEIQVVSLDDESGIIFREVIENQRQIVVPGDLVSGRYRVWIRALLADDEWSPWSNRTVSHFGTPTILSAEFLNDSNDLMVEWNAVNQAVEYRVFISNIDYSEVAIVDQTVSGQSILVPSIKRAGRLRIWVQAINETGFRSPWSQYNEQKVLTKGTGPIHHTPLYQPTFTWTDVPGADSYEFYLIPASGGEALYVKDIHSDSYTPDEALASRDYQWWVRAVTPTGRATQWSEAYRVAIGDISILTQESQLAETDVPLLQWNSLPEAQTYDVYIRSGQRTLRYFGLTETQLQVGPLPSGKCLVWIRANFDVGQGVWGPPRSFHTGTSGTGALLQNLRTASVASGSDSTFRWSQNAAVIRHELVIVGAERSYLFDGMTSTELAVPALPVGSYKWAVRAYDQSGVAGQWQYGNEFRTDGGIVLDVAGRIDGSRAFSLAWTEVLNASHYAIHIDNLNTGQKRIVRIDDLDNPFFSSETPLPKARYRVWVRAILQDGLVAPWSSPVDFEVV